MLSKNRSTLHKAPQHSAKREKTVEPVNTNRVVVLYVKVTDFGEGFINDIDRVTEIDCTEIVDGKLTKAHFHSFVKPDDPAFLKRCLDYYREKLDADQAKELSEGLAKAPKFSEIQKQFFEFLRKDNAQVIVHTINRVLHYLRRSCDADGLFILADHPFMRDIVSDARLLHKNGMYHAQQAPSEIDKDRDAVYKSDKEKKPSFRFEVLCNELGQKGMRRETWNATYDGRHLALAYINSRENIAKIIEIGTEQKPKMKKRK